MPYVLQRQDGKFVAPPGRPNSYVAGLQFARIFQTRESAEREKCGNESVLTLEQAAGR